MICLPYTAENQKGKTFAIAGAIRYVKRIYFYFDANIQAAQFRERTIIMLTKKEEKAARVKIEMLFEHMFDWNDLYNTNVLMHQKPKNLDAVYSRSEESESFIPFVKTSYTFVDSHNKTIKSMIAMRGSNECDGRILDKLDIPYEIGKKRLDITIKRLKQNNQYIDTFNGFLTEIKNSCTKGIMLSSINCMPLQKDYAITDEDYYYGIELFVGINAPEMIEDPATAHYYSVIRDSFDQFASIMMISKFARMGAEDRVEEMIEDLSDEPMTESVYKKKYDEERKKCQKLQSMIDSMKLELEEKKKNTKMDIELQKLRRENRELQKKNYEMEAELRERRKEEPKKTEDTKDLKRQISALTNDLDKIRKENAVLHSRLDSSGEVPLLVNGKEKDLYPGEIKDMILDSLNDYVRLHVHDGSRRKDVISDVLDSNDFQDNLKKRRDELRRVMKNENPMSLLRNLQQFGIKAEPEQKTHYKLVYYGDPRYFTTMAKSASDKSSYDNMMGNILRDFM